MDISKSAIHFHSAVQTTSNHNNVVLFIYRDGFESARGLIAVTR